MNSNLRTAALVAVAAAVLFIGCADPDPLADAPSMEVDSKSPARKTVDAAASMSDSSPDANLSESKLKSFGTTGTGLSKAGSIENSLVTSGREPGLDRETSNGDAGDTEPTENASDPAMGISSEPPSPSKKAKRPKKEFTFELVEASGNEGLSPGDSIPNINGKDIDGVKFQLNDYKGKVIMLDFWGDW